MADNLPEQQARIQIDQQLEAAGWAVQDVKAINLLAQIGVAVREFPTATGPADYMLFADGKAIGIVEAKKIDLSEISQTHSSFLPSSGYLYFFYDSPTEAKKNSFPSNFESPNLQF